MLCPSTAAQLQALDHVREARAAPLALSAAQVGDEVEEARDAHLPVDRGAFRQVAQGGLGRERVAR